MIGAASEHLIAGYLRPRQSVRRLLDGPHGLPEALLLVILAYLVGAVVAILLPDPGPAQEGVHLGMHLLGLLLQLVSFFVVSSLVYVVGRFFGGQGSRRDAYLGIAWYSLVTSLIAPLTLPARSQLVEAVDAADDGPIQIAFGTPMLLFTVASGIMLWLFACYVAELHRFRRTWSVLAAILGLSAAVSAIIMLIVSPA